MARFRRLDFRIVHSGPDSPRPSGGTITPARATDNGARSPRTPLFYRRRASS